MLEIKPCVVHIITTIERGGAEIQLVTLCKEQVKLGWEVHVVYLKGSPDLSNELERFGISVIKLSDCSFFHQIIQFSRLIKKLDVSLIHAHLPRAELVAALSATNRPLIVSRHNAEPFYPGSPPLVSRLLSNFCALRARKVLAISQSVKAFLIESFEVFSKQKVVVVHYGYDFDEVLDAESSENIWETRQLKVLSIGRLVPQKDIGTLLKGIQISYSRGVSLTVSIVGEGPLRTELVSLNTDLGLDGVVNFLPKTADTDSLYRWADLFVLSSVYEGFGLVLLEAINHDLPIICSRSSAAWEVLGDDYVGFFEVGNPKALANKLLDFAGLRQTMVDKLRLRKKYFSSRRMSMEIEMVYKAIMD